MTEQLTQINKIDPSESASKEAEDKNILLKDNAADGNLTGESALPPSDEMLNHEDTSSLYGLTSEKFVLNMNQSLDELSKSAGDYFNEEDALRVQERIKRIALIQRLMFIIVALLLPVIVLNIFKAQPAVRVMMIVLCSLVIAGLIVTLTLYLCAVTRLKKFVSQLKQRPRRSGASDSI